MTTHLTRIGGSIALIASCTFYPFLPGRYDGAAAPLSFMMQAFAIGGLLVVPIGICWLAYELRSRRRPRAKASRARYYFSLISLCACSFVVIAVCFATFVVVSPSVAVLALALSTFGVWRLRRGSKPLEEPRAGHWNAAPLYLVAIPIGAVILQLGLARPMREFSRRHAIEHSAELIADIEAYRAAHGEYPAFLHAAHKDYHPSVIGIEQFHYAPHRGGYNLFFERPALLVELGRREFVVFNARDEHVMMSHAAWILAGPPAELERRTGRPAVHDAPWPHWKYVWFD